MRKAVDYELVERLLGDESLSFNQIADLAGCSSWSVRKFARELAGDTRPMKGGAQTAPRRDVPASEPLGVVGWLVIGAVAIAFTVLCIIGARHKPGEWPPYPERGPM